MPSRIPARIPARLAGILLLFPLAAQPALVADVPDAGGGQAPGTPPKTFRKLDPNFAWVTAKNGGEWSVIDALDCPASFPFNAIADGLIHPPWKAEVFASAQVEQVTWKTAPKWLVAGCGDGKADGLGTLRVDFKMFKDSDENQYFILLTGTMQHGRFEGKVEAYHNALGAWRSHTEYFWVHDGVALTEADYERATDPAKYKARRAAEAAAEKQRQAEAQQARAAAIAACKKLYAGKAVNAKVDNKFIFDYGKTTISGLITGVNPSEGVASLKVTSEFKYGEVFELPCSSFH